MIVKNKMLTAVAVSTAVVLAGCGKESSPPAQQMSAPTPQQLAQSVAETKLPQREAMKPAESYRAIDIKRQLSGEKEIKETWNALLDAYWSAAKRDDNELSFDLSANYRKEKDSFKRMDIAKALKPELDSYLQKVAGQNRLVLKSTTSDIRIDISAFDPAKNMFPINIIGDEIGYGFNEDGWDRTDDIRIHFEGTPDKDKPISSQLKPKNEAEARAIEAAISSIRDSHGGSTIDLWAYGRVIATKMEQGTPRRRHIHFMVDAIAGVHPKTKQAIFVLGNDQLGPPKYTKEFREIVGVPEVQRRGLGYGL